MASNQPDNSCVNCRHRSKPETYRTCAICFQPDVPGNEFPGWELEAKPC